VIHVDSGCDRLARPCLRATTRARERGSRKLLLAKIEIKKFATM
jgi:hypothetical protein